MTRRFALAALATFTFTALVATAAQPAAAQTNGYTVTDLGLLSGATASFAKAVNDTGSVVGYATIPNGPNAEVYKGWLWTPSTPNAPSGTLRPLEPLAGRVNSFPRDINNAGLIVGNSVTYNSGQRHAGTFWQGPDYAPVDFNSLPRDPALAGWEFGSAVSVSDPAAVTGEIYVAGYGYYVAADGSTVESSIVWRVDAAGVIVGVTTLSGSPALGLRGDMNNRGQVTSSLKSAVGSDAFLWDGLGGTGTNLGTLGGTSAYGRGINEYGTVVGDSSTTAGTTRGFVWTPAVPNGTQGTMVALGTLSGTSSFAYGINDLNQIVGYAYLKGNRIIHATLWQNGATTPTDLNTLKKAGATGLELLEAYRINNRGGIIGRYSTNKGNRAFLLTPR